MRNEMPGQILCENEGNGNIICRDIRADLPFGRFGGKYKTAEYIGDGATVLHGIGGKFHSYPYEDIFCIDISIKDNPRSPILICFDEEYDANDYAKMSEMAGSDVHKYY